MAPVDGALQYLTVNILEVSNGGSFVATPSLGHIDYNYSIFLADLNNHMNSKGQGGKFSYSQKFQNGEICAVYCSTPEEKAKLWYRCRILLKLKGVQGVTAKVLLVDHGVETYVPGTLIRKLNDNYVNFPIQSMSCKLFGLKPLTYVASSESLVSRQIAKVWDVAAKSRLRELIKGHICRLQLHYVDKDGGFHVTLSILSDSNVGYQPSEINVNELLVEEKYAVFEDESPSENGASSTKDESQSDSSESMEDKTIWNAPVSSSEQQRLLSMKKKAEQMFNMRMESSVDDLRKDIGLPPAGAELTNGSMVPAGCDDGVKISDDESCMTGSLGIQRRKEESEKFMSRLLGGEGPSISDGPKDVSKLKPRDVWNSSKAPVLVDSQATKCDEPVADKIVCRPEITKSRKPARPNVASSSAAADSSTSDSEREAKPPSARPARKSVNPRAKRFELECLKQQLKDEEDENSFRSIESSQLVRLLCGESATDISQANANNSSPRKSAHAGLDFTNVLVHGSDGAKFFASVDELNVPIEMRGALRNNQTRAIITRPTPIQAHVWPAILRLRDVVGIDKEHSGKNLAYLLPIIMNILGTPLCYKNLPKGTGPILLILTVDWNRANNIKETCERILYQKRGSYRTKVLYGGRGKRDKEMVNMINGCEVLVATIPALLKMLAVGCTNFDRLCHMVFDNADVLVVKFVEEIKELMKHYAGALAKSIQLNLPHQLVAMATKWCYGLKSLIGAYFDNPVLVIVDKFEAAVYKQVKQYIEICSAAQRMDHIIEFLHGPGANHDVVMFTNSAGEAEKLEMLLESQSIAVVRATEFMSPPELKDIEASWNSSIHSGQCILVLSDKVAPRMTIRNATCIIHYEFPLKKNNFGNRMHCLLGSMSVKDDKSSQKTECCSLILLTERNEFCAPGILKLLRRARQHVPPFLTAIANKVQKQSEERKKNCDICDDLKLLGSCRDIQRCKQRHTIFADVDEPKTLPKSGVIKVKILDVVSANVFWGRVVEDPIGFEGMSKAYLKLEYEMQVFYQTKANHSRHGVTGVGVVEGDFCVFNSKNGYQRVRVNAITKADAQTAIATEVQLFGIDTAEWKIAKVDDLFVLPSSECFSLSNVPPQAIELIVCGVRPVDKSNSWTVEACIKIDNLINGKILEGKIVLSLRNTLWVDPLVQKTKLEGLNALSTSLHVGSELLEHGFAEKNNKHASNLRELCKDCLPSVVEPVLAKEKSEEERPEIIAKAFETMTLTDKDYQDVYVSAVEHPGLLFVQLMQSCDKIDQLDDKIEAVMKVLPNLEESDVEILGRGSLCLAKFTIDDKWYRAKILSVNESGEYHVFYVDHGDREWIPKTRLWKAWPDVIELPLQAIECSLVHITPVGAEWSSEDGDCLWDFCKGKLLVAKVKSKSHAEFAGSEKYNIELFDTTGEHDVNMSQEMIFLGHAKGSRTCIQEMFSDAEWCAGDRDCKNEVEKIPDICLQIYRAENDKRRVELAGSLQNIVLNIESQLDEVTTCGGVKSMAKLLALCKLPDVQNIIVAVIVYLAFKHPKISDDFRREGGLKALCNILAETKNEEVVEQITWALKSLGANKRNKDATRIYGGLTSLCGLLKESNNEKIILHAVEAIDVLCLENDLNCQFVHDNSGLKTLLGIIETSKNDKLLEESTSAVSTLSSNVRLRNHLRELKGIDMIAEFIPRCKNNTCLKNVLQTLKTATSANQLNRDYMRKIGLVQVIEKVLFSPLRHGLATKRLCSEILQRIEAVANATGSGQKTIQVTKIETNNELPPLLPSDDEPSLSPKTLWSQKKSMITISVQLRGVINEQVSISPRRIYFSSYTLEHRYELDMELYKEIDPKNSSWKVYGGEVLLTLKKVEQCVWPRLLLSEIKPPYLKCDFDRWVDHIPGFQEEKRRFDEISLPAIKPSESGKTKYANGGPDVDSSDSSDLSDDESSDEVLFDDLGPMASSD